LYNAWKETIPLLDAVIGYEEYLDCYGTNERSRGTDDTVINLLVEAYEKQREAAPTIKSLYDAVRAAEPSFPDFPAEDIPWERD
jgi:hypothetical protein